MKHIALIGVSLLLIYSIVQILNFYSVSGDVYGIYIMFYIFIVLAIIILPHDYPKI